jgi:CheY-like chemotaxis protein
MSRHALIIEDEILIAYEIQDVLERLGFDSFDLAASPTEAVACAMTHRPCLITADMRIVGGTGLEAVQAIVQAIGEVPVVYVTANADLLRGEVVATIVEKPIANPALAQACSLACGLSL